MYVVWTKEPIQGAPASRTFKTRIEAHNFAVQQYKSWIMDRPELIADMISKINDIRRHRPQGAISLGCWCAPLPCHGDVIISILNDL
jgi:hypothetical protein